MIVCEFTSLLYLIGLRKDNISGGIGKYWQNVTTKKKPTVKTRILPGNNARWLEFCHKIIRKVAKIQAV
jgi:hypothetical protein